MATGKEVAPVIVPPAEANWRELLSGQIRRHGGLLFRLALRVVKDRETAEDVCQQAYLQAWARPAVAPGALKAWLVTTIFNASLQVVRRRKIERQVVRLHAMSQPVTVPIDNAGPLRESLLVAIETLPPMPQAAVVLRLLEGMSGNDAKKVLGCSAGEVSKQLYLGLALLRTRLGTSLVELRK